MNKRMDASNTFSEEEVKLLDFITHSLMRGSMPSFATRDKAFPGLARKIQTMKNRIETKRKEAAEHCAHGVRYNDPLGACSVCENST